MRCSFERSRRAALIGFVLMSIAATMSPAFSQNANAPAAVETRSNDEVALARSKVTCADKNASADDTIAACTRQIEAAQGTPRERAEALVLRAAAYHTKKDEDRAIADCEAEIRLDPSYAPSFKFRGDALRGKGDHDKAIVDFTEAIRLDPDYARAYNNLGNVYNSRNDYDRAIENYSAAIRSDPRLAVPYNNRAVAYRNKGDRVRALADFDVFLKLEPNNAEVLNRRGNLYFTEKDYDRAVADFQAAVRIDPKHASARANIGLVKRQKGDVDGAIAEFDEAIRINPKYAFAYNARGYAQHLKGNQDAATADYGEAIRINPKDVASYYSLALIYRSKKDFDRAIANYSTALEVDPTHVAALTGRGLTHEAKRDLARARADFDNALRLPSKYENGKWAHDTARARLAVIGGPAPAATVPKPTSPQQATVTPPAASTPRTPSAELPGSSPPTVRTDVGVGDRVALVIGNGAYKKAPALPNPPNDARAMAAALRDIGFTVVSATDLDNVGMGRTILDFLRLTAAARTALVYYAGHGVQIDGKNYLVPIDASELSRSTAPIELFDLDRLLTGLDDEARANIIILDSCRDNPMETKSGLTRSGSRGTGLAGYSNVASSMLIAFATAPGQTAEDGQGAHSPFTTALLKHLRAPKLEINQMLNRVRADVREATKKTQTPWTNSSLMGDVFLGR